MFDLDAFTDGVSGYCGFLATPLTCFGRMDFFLVCWPADAVYILTVFTSSTRICFSMAYCVCMLLVYAARLNVL